MPGVKNEQVKQVESAASDALASVETLSVVPEPDPASPIGFAILAGVLGLAAGAVLGPWFERWFRRGH
jgi:hypothetical protein